MLPLIILIIISTVWALAQKLIQRKVDLGLAARAGMSAMLLFTAMGHFLFTEGMALMIPDPIPFKTTLVLLTALLEIAAAVGLHSSKRRLTGWLLILFFILILPANINAAIHQLDYKTGAVDGPGIVYLWFRVPVQIIYIIWTYLSTIKLTNNENDRNRRTEVQIG